LKIYKSVNRNLSLQDIYEDLEQIAQIKKCSFCGCNADTLKEFAAITRNQGSSDLAERAISLHNETNQKKALRLHRLQSLLSSRHFQFAV
jgi:hypothetical protein